jgi:hypothetical protein
MLMSRMSTDAASAQVPLAGHATHEAPMILQISLFQGRPIQKNSFMIPLPTSREGILQRRGHFSSIMATPLFTTSDQAAFQALFPLASQTFI